jgi:AraC-like DNA-binding protein
MDSQGLIAALRDASPREHQLSSSSDLAEVQNTVAQKMLPHTIRLLDSSKYLKSNLLSIELGNTSIVYIDYGTDVLLDLGMTENHYIVDIPLRGKTQIMTGYSEAEIGQGFIGISQVTRSLKYIQDADCSTFSLKIPRSSLEQCLMEQTGSPLGEPIEFQVKTGIDDGSGQSFLQTMTHICQMLRQENSSLSRPFVASSAERYALTTLLNTIPNNYSDWLTDTAKLSGKVPYYVTQAQDYILRHLDQPITMDDVVATVDISARSLFYAFKKHLGASPMTYARRARLDRARQALLTNDPSTTTVTDVAVKWCFFNHGSFSNLYAKQYGEKPSETLKKAKVLTA